MLFNTKQLKEMPYLLASIAKTTTIIFFEIINFVLKEIIYLV